MLNRRSAAHLVLLLFLVGCGHPHRSGAGRGGWAALSQRAPVAMRSDTAATVRVTGNLLRAYLSALGRKDYRRAASLTVGGLRAQDPADLGSGADYEAARLMAVHYAGGGFRSGEQILYLDVVLSLKPASGGRDPGVRGEIHRRATFVRTGGRWRLAAFAKPPPIAGAGSAGETSWAYALVTWHGRVYRLTGSPPASVGAEIGTVSEYDTVERSVIPDGFSNALPVGTGIYAVPGEDVADGVAVRQPDGSFRMAAATDQRTGGWRCPTSR